MSISSLPTSRSFGGVITEVADSAALLDGLYAAVDDAGLEHRRAEDALARARRSGDAELIAAASEHARACAIAVSRVAEGYRSALYSLAPETREAYLSDRHPYLYAG